MTNDHVGSGAAQPTFETLMAEVMTTAPRFGHREHVHLTWLAVRSCGTRIAVALVSEGIQRTARYAGAPRKYHATVSEPGSNSLVTMSMLTPAPTSRPLPNRTLRCSTSGF
jgi:hypothetical protein